MKTLIAGCLLALPLLAPLAAQAQAFPSKPIRWLVPYPAGGGSDFLARTIGQTLSTQTGQPVLVDNKPGGNTALGAAETVVGLTDAFKPHADKRGLYRPNVLRAAPSIVPSMTPVGLKAAASPAR